MGRVLLLNYYFPPLGGIASLRAMRFARHLPSFGWTPHVITVRAGDYHHDPQAEADIGPTRVDRTASIEVSRGIRPALRQIEGSMPTTLRSKALGRLRRIVRAWVYFPDAAIGWYPFALAAGRRAIRANRPNAILSSSGPITAHLVARQLARESGLPWIAEFRDLWSEWGHLGERRRRREEALEARLVRAAAQVVTVSATYASALARKGAAHVAVVTNGFDPESFESPPPPIEPVAAYLGSFFPGAQDLETALRALRRLWDEGTGLRFRVVGAATPALRGIIERSGMSQHSECTGFLPQSAAVTTIRRASILVLAGPISAHADVLRGHIPAKTFEYLGARRPILALGSPDADVMALLRPIVNARAVDVGDVPGACDAVRSLLHSPILPEASTDRFTSRALAERLARLLDAVEDSRL